MNKWRVQSRLLMLAFAPLLFVIIALTSIYVWSRTAELEHSLDHRGQAIVNYLAPASEYAIFSSNKMALDTLAKAVLQEGDVVYAAIFDADNRVMAEIEAPAAERNTPGRSGLIYYSRQVISPSPLTTEDTNSDLEVYSALPGTANIPPVLGKVVIALDPAGIKAAQKRVLITALALSTGILLLTIPLVILISRTISEPLARMTKAVAEIKEGRFQQHNLAPSGGELGLLQEGINNMAAGLKAAHEEIQNRYKTLFNHSSDAVFLLKGGFIVDCNERAVILLGIKKADIMETRLGDYITLEHEQTGHSAVDFEKEVLQALSGTGSSFESSFLSADGDIISTEMTLVPTEINRAVHLIVFVRDITEKNRARKKLEYQANYDAITGLPNRILAMDRLTQALKAAHREQHSAALLFIDVDRFKSVNDSMGHQAGDTLLAQIGKRLQQLLRETDTVARLGGDEFLIILGHISHREDATNIAEKVSMCISQAFSLDNREVHLGASVGIAIYPDDGDTPEALLKNADTAMYKAKYDGKNTYRYYNRDIGKQAEYWLELEQGLKSGLDNTEFSLRYQPLACAKTGVITQVEVLLRWHSAKLGDIPPSKFISVAEETGTIIRLGDWVLEQLCRDMGQMDAAAPAPIRYAVNISGRQLADDNFCGRVATILGKYGVPTEKIEFEITESVLIREADTLSALNRLKELGITLSLDDFGVGYSSLSYLSQYPFDTLKIDRSFVNRIDKKDEGENLCDAIITIANRLGLRVSAEGIETQPQYDFLVRHAVDLLQGHYISRPLTRQQLIAHLTGNDSTGPLPAREQTPKDNKSTT